MVKGQTCLENLNNALINLAKNDERIIFLGEDIKDPYGGAFKVEKGLSTMFADRIISTPISEESFTGFAAGLSMRGYKPIVDLMFSDFMALTMDMVINFLSKYPQMYGRELSLPIVLRSANGGYRGYGATHSQSMQKFFFGIPNIYVYEMSPFHDNEMVFKKMFSKNKACIFFEEKIIYGEKMYLNVANNIFELGYLGSDDNWAHLSTGNGIPDIAVICPGGMSKICLSVCEKLLLDYEIETEVFIPSQLYPCEVSDIIEKLNRVKNVLIVEESTGGSAWGACVLETVNNMASDFMGKIKLVSSKPSVIPAYRGIEDTVLVSEREIIQAVVEFIE